MSLLETKGRREAVCEALAIYDATAEWEADLREQMLLCSDLGVPLVELRAAFNDCNNPAKLAEMIANEARRCGIQLYGDVPEEEFTYPYIDVIAAQSGVLVDYAASKASIKDEPCPVMGLLEARVMLAALLQLPDGAKEAAEKVLRGET